MNYNISEINFENFIVGSGWPCYKNISIKEMTDTAFPRENDMNNNENNMNNMEETETTPKYDTMPGTSSADMTMDMDVNPKDVRLMKKLYSRLNKILMPLVEDVLDEYEYVSSPIYDEEGIDRETLSQLIDKVLEMAREQTDEAQEIMVDIKQTGWGRNELLTSLVQAIVLNEIFMVRRPRYRRAKNNYRFYNGNYMGIRQQ